MAGITRVGSHRGTSWPFWVEQSPSSPDAFEQIRCVENEAVSPCLSCSKRRPGETPPWAMMTFVPVSSEARRLAEEPGNVRAARLTIGPTCLDLLRWRAPLLRSGLEMLQHPGSRARALRPVNPARRPPAATCT
jgi:hypothetical protein